MSDAPVTEAAPQVAPKSAERPKYAPQQQGRGPMMGQRAAENAISFGPSHKRLLARLKPERARVALQRRFKRNGLNFGRHEDGLSKVGE